MKTNICERDENYVQVFEYLKAPPLTELAAHLLAEMVDGAMLKEFRDPGSTIWKICILKIINICIIK